MKITLTPHYDSFNDDPPEVTFEELSKTVQMEIADRDGRTRTIQLRKDQFLRACDFFLRSREDTNN